MIQRIGWIGAGVMGRPMAGRLLEAGYEVSVFSRTRAKAEPLLERGARWAGSAADAANGADVAISIVGTPDDVEETHLGLAGTLAAASPPRIIVDMTTSRPSLAMRIADVASARGVGAVDAPVSGGDVGARNGTLSIMIGAAERDYDYLLPILNHVGKTIVRHGGPGAGQHCKMVNQILIASSMVGACEGLLYAERAGLAPGTVLQSVATGAAGSWTVSNLWPRMIERDFSPGFAVKHFVKDLRIALEGAADMNLDLPGLALAHRLYAAFEESGGGERGTHALFRSLMHRNSASASAAVTGIGKTSSKR